ncbi:hypothetical protein V8E54_001973 [Elaphomyces granulatus]
MKTAMSGPGKFPFFLCSQCVLENPFERLLASTALSFLCCQRRLNPSTALSSRTGNPLSTAFEITESHSAGHSRHQSNHHPGTEVKDSDLFRSYFSYANGTENITAQILCRKCIVKNKY